MITDEWIQTKLPADWLVVRLIDHAQLVNGYPFDSKLFTPDTGIPLVRIRDIDSSDTEVCYSGEPVPEALIQHGDILVGMDGEFNVSRWKGGEALLNQRVCCIRPKSTVDGRFLSYLLPIPLKLINDFTYSTTVKHLSSLDVLKIRFPFPPMSRQRPIADYLDAETDQLDALIGAKRRLLTLLGEKRTALTTRAVTRGVGSKCQLRGSGVSWLGEIPSHWETCRIAWLFHERDQRGEPDLPLLEVSISAGVVRREFSTEKIESTAADFNTYKVARRGDVVFNKMRMWQGAVGVAPEHGLVSPDYVVAAPAATLSTEYAGLLFRTPVFSAECGRRSHGIVWDRLRLYWDEFRDIAVPLPPPNEQAGIVAHVGAETRELDALSAATTRTIALLKERRSALIAAAVTGQVDVGSKA